jgi:hypothetical protein
MKLGIIYKDGKVINHRSLVKVLFNPIFRFFGFHLATRFDGNNLLGAAFMKCERVKPIRWDFKFNTSYDKIEKRRRII